MARTLLLVAATTGYQTRMFAGAARRLGVNVELATDRCRNLEDPWGDQAFPVRFEKPEASARQLVNERHYDAVVAVGDRPAYLASLAAAEAGLRFHPPEAVAAAIHKFSARKCFRRAGMLVPVFFRVGLDEDLGPAIRRALFPCVLKPLGLSASRGVIRAGNPEQFRRAFERIRKILDAPDLRRRTGEQDRAIQVEEFLPGREFALEGLVTGGRLQVLALFDKPDPLDGPFFEETIYVTPSRQSEAMQDKIAEAAQQAVSALGLWHGPVHAEMRVAGDRVWMLEAAPRPIGGLCAKSLIFEPDMPLEELIVRHALGEDVSTARRRGAASGVMMIPIPSNGIYQGVRGTGLAAAVEGISEVIITAKQGQALAKLPEGNSYLGFLFARGADPASVETSLRRAHALLEFDISPTLPVVSKPAGA